MRGPVTCGNGQICVTSRSGLTCQVNPDAGIGPDAVYSWACYAVPAECGGIPSCDCVRLGAGICLGVSGGGRAVDFGCS